MEKFKYHGYIYITINQQTNKVYVGQKSKSPEKSINYLGSGALLKKSIKKYGERFFKKIILGEIFSNDIKDFKKQLDEAETECIYFFRSYGADGENIDQIYGYNLTPRGNSQLGVKFSEERRLLQSFNTKKRYEDPEERLKTGKASHQRFIDNPEMTRVYREATKKHRKENPEILLQISNSLKESYKKEGRLEQHSASQKLHYKQNPERSINLSKSLLLHNQNHPETSQSKSEKMKQFYKNNPEERTKRAEEVKQRHEDPEYSKKCSNAQKNSFIKNPDRRRAISNAVKKRYEDPEERKKASIRNKIAQNKPETKKKKSLRFSGKGSSTYKEVDTIKILELFNQGKTYKEISLIIGCSTGIVKTRIKNPEKYL